MSSIDDGTQTIDAEAESNDWQTVLSHAKAMQRSIERYTVYTASSQDRKEVSSSVNQLCTVGNSILTFVETISENVDPLIKSLDSETSLDANSEISKKVFTAQDAAIHALIKSLSELSTQSNLETATQPAVAEGPNPALPPDVQAIKDSFDKMIEGKTDPRMGYGKIPSQPPPKTAS